MLNNPHKSQLMMLLVMVLTGGVTLTDEQEGTIISTIMSALAPQSLPPTQESPDHSSGETVRGMAELATLLGVSIPTACKISQSGKFDAARLNFGTKKFVWDKAKLIEIARKK